MSGLPKGWATANLGTFGDVYCGQSSTASDVNSEGYGTPYVTGPEQWTGETINLNKWTTTPKRVVPEKCIFITVKGASVGKMFPGISCAIGRDVYAYRPARELSYPFVAKALAYTVNAVIREARGDIPGLSKEHITDHAVPLPPLAEQERILAKLDALSARSARARTELARMETLVSRYKQAVLSKAFSGNMAKEWPSVPLDRLSELMFDGPFGSNLKSVDYTTAGPRVVRLENIGARVFIEQKRTHISEDKFHSLSRHQLQAGDLLFSSFVSEEIRACLFPADFDLKAINKADCFCIRFDPFKFDPKFALLQLTSESTYRFFVQQVHGATRPRINLSQLKQYPILAPPLKKQHEIVRRIESAFARIDRLAADANRALTLLGKLDEAILAKAFRGELVPQDENDEPASVLLDRIRAERAAAPKQKRGRAKR